MNEEISKNLSHAFNVIGNLQNQIKAHLNDIPEDKAKECEKIILDMQKAFVKRDHDELKAINTRIHKLFKDGS